jgi:hypothetical protein
MASPLPPSTLVRKALLLGASGSSAAATNGVMANAANALTRAGFRIAWLKTLEGVQSARFL